jgi:Bacterial archaeo-eukaryotic release factor family 2
VTERLTEYAELYRQPGPWCSAYLDASAGTVDIRESEDAKRANVRAALAAQGASEADLDAVEAVVQPAAGEPAPVSRFVLVRQGTVQINELLPGPLVGPEQVEVQPVPDLLPLLKHHPDDFPYVVAEVSRDEGEIRLHRAGQRRPEQSQEVQGSRENLHKVPGGGWAHLRLQHHTEEIWRRNADQVAGEIDRIIRDSGAKLLVLAGDVRARQLVQEQLAEASRAVLTVVDTHVHAPGADRDAFNAEVEERVAEQWATDQAQVLDRLAEQEGQANPESATGLGVVIHALQQAQVDVLIFNDQTLAERRVLALGAEPWIATAEEESLGAEILGKIPAPAALLRAAALTDARILLVPKPALPEGVDIAALLRWPTGPAAPSA